MLKKTKIKLDLLTDINFLLMVEKGVRGGIFHWIFQANNKYMKNYDKNKESSYLQYLDVNNLIIMDEKLPVKNFKWVKDISTFDESFMRSYNEESNKAYFLAVDVWYPGIYIIFKMIYFFCLQEWKLKK